MQLLHQTVSKEKLKGKGMLTVCDKGSKGGGKRETKRHTFFGKLKEVEERRKRRQRKNEKLLEWIITFFSLFCSHHMMYSRVYSLREVD